LALVLTEAGQLAAAGRVCAAGLARSREAGDPWNQARLLLRMATLDLRAACIQDAAAHLRESLQIAARTGDQFDLRNGLDCCGYMCAATGRLEEAVTVWAAYAALSRREGYAYPPGEARRQMESLRKAQHAIGPARARAAEERGTLVAHGRTNAQIAAHLYISVRTVTSHLDRIRDKTGCRRRADLTRLALSEGLV
jgi:DNA-binding CsgD family transcriptional regulator